MPALVTSGRARDIPAKVRALIPGSCEAPCRACGESLLLSPSSQALIDDGAFLICPSCVERLLPDGTPVTRVIDQGALEELRRAMMQPRDEELN